MEQVSSARIAIKWGIISALISMISAVIIYNFDLWKQSWLPAISLIITVILLTLAMKEYRTLNNGYMTLGQGFGLGMLMTAVSSLLSISFDMLYKQFIDPTIQEQIMEFQEDKLLNSGMSQEQVDAAVETMSKFNQPGIQFLVGIGGALLFGAFLSLIVAAVMQKKRPVFE